MERLLLLWDELDELVGYGRHVVSGFSFPLTLGRLRLRRPRLLSPAPSQA